MGFGRHGFFHCVTRYYQQYWGPFKNCVFFLMVFHISLFSGLGPSQDTMMIGPGGEEVDYSGDKVFPDSGGLPAPTNRQSLLPNLAVLVAPTAQSSSVMSWNRFLWQAASLPSRWRDAANALTKKVDKFITAAFAPHVAFGSRLSRLNTSCLWRHHRFKTALMANALMMTQFRLENPEVIAPPKEVSDACGSAPACGVLGEATIAEHESCLGHQLAHCSGTWRRRCLVLLTFAIVILDHNFQHWLAMAGHVSPLPTLPINILIFSSSCAYISPTVNNNLNH